MNRRRPVQDRELGNGLPDDAVARHRTERGGIDLDADREEQHLVPVGERLDAGTKEANARRRDGPHRDVDERGVGEAPHERRVGILRFAQERADEAHRLVEARRVPGGRHVTCRRWSSGRETRTGRRALPPRRDRSGEAAGPRAESAGSPLPRRLPRARTEPGWCAPEAGSGRWGARSATRPPESPSHGPPGAPTGTSRR